jgi:two-component system sensor histidine kinase DesK
LGEVREAASGYRQPTLDGELAGARMALSAAGISAEVVEARVALDPAVEAVLAWAVREAATNVIRHSGARHCTVRITASLTDAGVEVIDDGVGEAAASANGGASGAEANGSGHGIAGLAERARLVDGTLTAGALAGGGYRLAVTVPVPRA